MKKRFNILFLPALAIALYLNCQRTLLAPLPDLPESFLQSAPDTLVVGEQSFVLRTYLWRDFMPMLPPGGPPLLGVIKIETIDSSAIVVDINSDACYIVANHQVQHFRFDADPPPDHPDRQPFRLLKIFRNGPKLTPRIYVDVIVRISISHKQKYLRASQQYIDAVY